MIRLTCLLILMAQPALALSCLRPDVARTYQIAHESPATYVLAKGTITVREGEVVHPGVNQPAIEDYTVRATFEGRLASPDGFDEPAEGDLTIEIGCAGNWCGGVPGGEVIAFIELRDGAAYLAQGACPQNTFAATPEIEAAALSCLTGGECTPTE